MKFRQPDKVIHGLVWKEKDIEFPYSEIKRHGVRLKYSGNSRVDLKRVNSFYTKEPTTLDWIDSFNSDDVLFDIGGNVGMYSIYAAVTKGCQVIAFEPSALNYAALNRNIHINNVGDKVQAYCLACSTETKMDTLYLSRFADSYSHHDFGENRWEGPVVHLNTSPEARPRQGCMSVCIDSIIDKGWVEEPTHIKIDVDGLEYKVVEGLRDTLHAPGLRSILIETDFSLQKSRELRAIMQGEGFYFSYDQVCTNREGKMTPEEWERDFAAGRGGYNIIWFKKAYQDFYNDHFARTTA